MESSFSLLWRLLFLSFDNDNSILSVATSSDLEQLVLVSIRQGVASLVVDGIQKLHETGVELGIPVELKYQLFGQVMQDEMQYARQWKAACGMAEHLAEGGLTTYVLKGFAVSQMYPIPEHRNCCDLDCFLMHDDRNVDACELGNGIIEGLGVKVNRDFYKNSTFHYKGLMVENHKFCSPVRGGKRRKLYEQYLRSIMVDGSAQIGDSKMMSPGPLFNALFLTSHAQAHFLMEGGICLRHICDWGMLLKAYQDEGHELWDAFIMQCRYFGMDSFAFAMSRVAAKVCGVNVPFECPINAMAETKLLDDVLMMPKPQLYGHNVWITRLLLLKTMWKSRWKYKMFSDKSFMSSLFETMAAFIFERKPII